MNILRNCIPLLIGSIMFGCDGAVSTKEIDENSSPLSIAARNVDQSGRIETKVFLGGSILTNHNATATANVQSGWVLVGGGCKITWSGSSGQGALLTASYPEADLSTWTCKSKDHVRPWTHTLNAYAIGMRITGINESDLRKVVRRNAVSSQQSSAPTASSPILAEELLIGGGASAEYGSGAGGLLIGSFPMPDGSAWIAKSKDNYVQCLHSVVAYSITMPKNVFGMNFSNQIQSNSTYGAEYVHTYDASIYVNDAFALTSVGGYAQATESYIGRYLFAIYPDLTGYGNWAYASAKDHIYPMGGNTSPFWIGVRKI